MLKALSLVGLEFPAPPEDTLEDILEDTPMDKPEDTPEDTPMDKPEDTPEDTPKDKPEDAPEDTLKDIAEGRDVLECVLPGPPEVSSRGYLLGCPSGCPPFYLFIEHFICSRTYP
jgi:hypothetical protein